MDWTRVEARLSTLKVLKEMYLTTTHLSIKLLKFWEVSTLMK